MDRIEPVVRKAREHHFCSECNGIIPKGAKYTYSYARGVGPKHVCGDCS